MRDIQCWQIDKASLFNCKEWQQNSLLLETIGDEPLELFVCDKHDDVPGTKAHERWSEPAHTQRTTRQLFDDYDFTRTTHY